MQTTTFLQQRNLHLTIANKHWKKVLSGDWPYESIKAINEAVPSDNEFRDNYYNFRATDAKDLFEKQKDSPNQEYGSDFGYDENKHGYRCDDFDVIMRRPTKKLLALGCSFTYGIGVPEAHTWPRLLANWLEQIYGDKIDVINLGVPGGSVFQCDMHLNWFDKFNPDYAVALWPEPSRTIGINDRGYLRHMGRWISDTTNENLLKHFYKAHIEYAPDQLMFTKQVMVGKFEMLERLTGTKIAHLDVNEEKLRNSWMQHPQVECTPADIFCAGNPRITTSARDLQHYGTHWNMRLCKQLISQLTDPNKK